MYKIKLMTSSEILMESPAIMETLQRAWDNNLCAGWDVEDVIKHTLTDSANFQLWKVHDKDGRAIAYGSTRSILYPKFSALCIVSLANVTGDPVSQELYAHTLYAVEKLAKEGGFKKIEVVGRKGWLKRLKPMGYDQDYVTFSKVIGDNNENN